MQLRTMRKSKIHRARITKKDIHYEGSIGIDKALLEAAGIYKDEMVQVLNINNGARFETYVIEEQKNSGVVSLYGPAAHLGEVGDLIIIISYFPNKFLFNCSSVKCEREIRNSPQTMSTNITIRNMSS